MTICPSAFKLSIYTLAKICKLFFQHSLSSFSIILHQMEAEILCLVEEKFYRYYYSRWQCSASSRHEAAAWASEQPDLSDCKSVPMTNLEVKVRQEDPENVLASSLARLTGSRQLYGGDLQVILSSHWLILLQYSPLIGQYS